LADAGFKYYTDSATAAVVGKKLKRHSLGGYEHFREYATSIYRTEMS
jgi:hypothetical protein